MLRTTFYKFAVICFMMQYLFSQASIAQSSLLERLENDLNQQNPEITKLKSERNKVNPDQDNQVELINKYKSKVAMNNSGSTGNTLSPIEKMFNGDLKQFGYDLFNTQQTFDIAGSIGNDYKFSIGDKVKVYLWGDTIDFLSMSGTAPIEPVIDTMVDTQGNIFIPGLGSFQAANRSLSDLQDDVEKILSQKYTNVKVKLSINQPKNLSVVVTGNVNKPGMVYVSNNTNVINALRYAGGLNKNGSLREVLHIDGMTGFTTKIDLYELLINGNLDDIYLQQDDIILVKPIGKVVALSNGVKMPAIYEMKDKETAQNIITFAGGLLPTVVKNKFFVETISQAKEERVINEYMFGYLNSFQPSNGDLVKFKGIYAGIENQIILKGNIKRSGEFQYKPGMRLSDIIHSKDDLLKETYTKQAIIERVAGRDRENELIAVSLNEFFAGIIDPKLEPQDIITILSATQVGTINIVGGVVNNTGILPLKEDSKLRDILTAIKFNINTNDIVVETSDKEVVYLHDLLTKNNEELNIPLKSGQTLFFREVKPNENLKKISLLGYVSKPDTYKFSKGTHLLDAIIEAGGLTDEAYLKGIVVMRESVAKLQQEALKRSMSDLEEQITLKTLMASKINDEKGKESLDEVISTQKKMLLAMKEKAQKQYGRIVINFQEDNPELLSANENITLEDGDVIYIPHKPNYIIVMGEVYNQSAIVFEPDKKSKYYLSKVGGPTKEANKKEIYIIRANGEVVEPKKVHSVKIASGDAIIVPRKIKIPFDLKGTLVSVTQVLANIAQTAFMLVKL